MELLQQEQTYKDISMVLQQRYPGERGFSEMSVRRFYSRLVFSWFLDLCGYFGNAREKPTRKTCFFCEKKRLNPRIYQAKFFLAAFL